MEEITDYFEKITDYFEEELIPFELKSDTQRIEFNVDNITKLQMYYLGRICAKAGVELGLYDSHQWYIR